MSTTPPRTATTVRQTTLSPTTFLPTSRIVPSYPENNIGWGGDIWKRILLLQAKMPFCLVLLLPFQQASSSTSTGASSSFVASIRGPAEGDANCQTRQANLLYEWTDKTTDRPICLSCDITSPTLGHAMYKEIILKYELQSNCDIGVYTDRLTVPQRKTSPSPPIGSISSPQELILPPPVVLLV